MTTNDPLPELRLEPLACTVMHFTFIRPDEDEAPLFDLTAPYQRGSVWTLDQRRALIKSLVMGLPIGSVITSKIPYQRAGASYRVIDGKQRIETVRAFERGDFTVPGWWFRSTECEHRAGEVAYPGLTVVGQRHFDNQMMGELLFDAITEWTHAPGTERGWRTRTRTADEVLRAEAELYGLVNGGGTAQTDEDMARAAVVARGEG